MEVTTTASPSVEAPEDDTPPQLEPSLGVSTPARVDFLRFALGDKAVVAGLKDGSVLVYRLKNLAQHNPNPSHSFPSTGSALIDILPNPSPTSPLVVILTAAALIILDVATCATTATLPIAPTAACWSVKGKQVVVGGPNAVLTQYTPEGAAKAELAPPAELGESGPYVVGGLEWLENNVFLVTYSKPTAGGEPVHEDEVYVLSKGPVGVEYTKFDDPTPPFGMTHLEGRKTFAKFKNWAPFKHLVLVSNAASADIGVIGQSDHWATLALPETCRPSVPLTEAGEDTTLVGLELDLSSTAPTVVGSGDDPRELPPSPSVLIYTSEGVLINWQLTNEQGGAYEGIVTSRDVLTAEDEPAEGASDGMSLATTPAQPTTPAPAFGAPSSSPFAAPAASAFGGASSKTPSPFGAPTFGASAFGASPAAPAFGASGFSAFGTSGTKPASLAPSTATGSFAGFGGAASTSSGPASSTGGFAGFGAAAKPAAFGASAFPTPAAGSAFGSGSAFGAAPTFGSSGFRAAASKAGSPAGTPPPATGAFAGFGKPATPTPPPAGGAFAGFGAAAAAGAASASGGFGGFGSSSGGFGALAGKPAESPFAAKPAGESPFGKSSAFGSGSAFPAAASSSPFGGSSPSGSAFGSGGSAPKSAFGASVSASPSAFGAGGSAPTSAFGTGGSASGSAFGAGGGGFAKFGATSTTPSRTPTNSAFGSTGRAATDDSDDDGAEAEEDDGRVDDPPDLEPTKTNLEFGAVDPKPSPAAAQPAAPAATAAGSTLGFGGLGFGAAPTTPAKAGTSPATVSIFGAAAAAKSSSPSFGAPASSPFGAPATSAFGAAATKPAAGFGAFSGAKPATGFSFGAAPAVTSAAIQPATGFSFAAPTAPPAEVEVKPEPAPLPPSPTPAASAPLTPAPLPPSPKAAAPPAPVTPSLEAAIPSAPLPPSPTQVTPQTEAVKAAATTLLSAKTEADEVVRAASPASAKSLFGFASSPPLAAPAGSLFSRLSEANAGADDGEDGEEEEEYSGEEYDDDEEEEEDEEENEGEDGEEYSDEYEEEERDSDKEDDDEDEDEEAAAAPATPSAVPSLLSRLSPSPDVASTPSGSTSLPSLPPSKTPVFGGSGFSFSATPSGAPPAPAPPTPTPAPFPTLSLPLPTPPAVASAKVIPLPVTPAPSTPAMEKPAFSFGAPPAAEANAGAGTGTPKAAPPAGGYFGFTSSAPRASSPLASGPAVSAPEEEEAGKKEGTLQAPAFGGFGGIGKPAQTSGEGVKPAAPFGEFAGFGKPAGTEDKKDEAKPAVSAVTAPAFGGFAGFGKPADAPAGPAVGGFGGFGGLGKPAAAPAATAAAAAAATAPAPAAVPTGFGGFAGFGKPASAAAPAPAVPAASKGGFSFGAPPAAAPVPAAAPAAKPATSPFAASASSLPFGVPAALPLGAPSAAPPPASPIPTFPPAKAPAPGGFSFGAPPVTANPAAAPAVIKPTPVVPPPVQSIAATQAPAPGLVPAAPAAKQGPALADLAKQVPKVGSQLAAAVPPRVDEAGMTGEFAKAYLVLANEFEVLKRNAQAVKAFAKDVGQGRRVDSQEVDFDDRKWALGDLAQLGEATKLVGPKTAGAVAEAQALQRQAAELQSLLLKAETKREEAARFIRARSDPVFAKLVRVRQLGPEQVEYQKNIRLQVEGVRARIEQVEEHLVGVKDKVRQDRQGKTAFKAPSLDSVNRAVRNITSAVKDKASELDDLALRIDLLNVGGVKAGAATSTPAKERGAAVTRGVEDWLEGSPLRIGQGSPVAKLGGGKANGHEQQPSSVLVASDAAARKQAGEAALGSVRAAAAIKKAMLAVRTAPVLNQAGARGVDQSEVQQAFAKGPVTAAQLPKPRGPRPAAVPKAVPAIQKVQLPPLVASPAAKPVVAAPVPAPIAPLFPKTAANTTPAGSSFGAASQAPGGFAGFTGFTSPVGVPPAGPGAWSLATQPGAPAPGAFPVFKAPAAISFSAPFVPALMPSAGGSRSGAGGRTSSRMHTPSVKLKAAEPSAEPAKTATFDWGPMPTAAVPPKREVGGFVSLSAGPALGSATAVAPPPAKPAFSFGLPPAQVLRPAAPAPGAVAPKVGGFGLVDEEEDEEEESKYDEEENEYEGEDGEEGWDEEDEPEGLEAISERDEE